MSDGWDWRELSPLALAFIGDAVWEIWVRNHVLRQGVRRPDMLHKRSSRYVRATAQAQIVQHMFDSLTAEEQGMVKRGRNAKPAHTRKNTDVLDYRHSTGFETLIGYLYGSEQTERLEEVCRAALTIIDREEENRSNGR
ncbi:Mini-ribonuclease 3 [Alicyclobacillus sp. SO9]|uniref:Mini-ribonuclease 3 n=1 Tax=Alicyclobacillus sp. SO9 TaxID=2665646 RepID=UPI0018E78CC0|nr:ribonuclease III domain-containing protein [Alicyclobacillus sp. SO9]QQE78547.1 ribonuclease III [Alicyclobacillus sp. SO9]